MKVAFATWDNRIAPVFDVARQIHLIEAESGRILTETQEVLPDDMLPQKALRLAEMGVGTLVCGAISRPLHKMVIAYGIQVIPFVAGDLKEVIQAWMAGTPLSVAFAMPGCCGEGHRRRFRSVCCRTQEEYPLTRGRRGNGRRDPGRQDHGTKQRPSAAESPDPGRTP